MLVSSSGHRAPLTRPMSHADRVLNYLWSIAPSGATNCSIAHALGIGSHQTVYSFTQELLRRKLLRAERSGREWVFYAEEEESAALESSGKSSHDVGHPERQTQGLSLRQFELLARRVLSSHFGTVLSPRSVPGVRREFGLVSVDRRVVGDAHYYADPRGVALRSVSFSAIAELVWLLEKTEAPVAFLVFGHDPGVPTGWLQRYGDLARGVSFYFLGDDGTLDSLMLASSGPSTGR